MISKVVEKLEEADQIIKEDIKLAHNRMRNLEEAKCCQARILIQEALTELLKCGG